MAIAGYPPAHHILSDLGFEADITDSGANVRVRVSPHLTEGDGGIRAGVLAILVDVAGGAVALRALQPDWMATADLTLQVVRPATGPFVEARASVLRKGRTTLVIEAGVFNVSDGGSDGIGDGIDDAPVAWATMTFAILPGTSPASTLELSPDPPTRLDFNGAGLDCSVVDALSISTEDAGEGRVSMPVRAYVFNSFGAVQGGVMALLGAIAGAEALAGAAGVGAESLAVTDLQVAYLALGRVGPIVSRSRVLDGGTGGSHRSAVVELIDEGAGGRLTTVISIGAHSVDDGSPGLASWATSSSARQ